MSSFNINAQTARKNVENHFPQQYLETLLKEIDLFSNVRGQTEKKESFEKLFIKIKNIDKWDLNKGKQNEYALSDLGKFVVTELEKREFKVDINLIEGFIKISW